jgi:hypothetical protein
MEREAAGEAQVMASIGHAMIASIRCDLEEKNGSGRCAWKRRRG